ncbi:bifunctional 5,10-methylenetetrahydrofolate dehydrogenase/5,10-methenyltetrahydrofolate cyclohydrolase [Candidatus Anaplasma sp. TIGMIC]|uniref:bifunctional 5,10-methylenetetrahydrofolate dehydrogenase/5,10-methenyltetrahydrofolate cyclohydrolase n=1 Tax=Candidatus Anaplasma sp. TIGMIC TaxID=3020713 RepID=UPI00232D4B32|nr:bifunctional methylenetetrahydrofolate dehydrogenase/methenyltetrahydrofolate cyclohydrolase FolD [Candidatus Anaplasma sp. TIGMIC]MDB1135810.1 bifunctional methylenetetrahydrofolate dehydrogenase/methenyltetrahydrofolate cyclohydrolase FolD [Candidatus Anaplasma sp. TIGMIC]
MNATNSNIIDGKRAATDLLAQLGLVIDSLKNEHGLVPALVVIIVGDDPASKLYVGNKQRKAEELGLVSKTIALPAETTQAELLSIIDALNADANVHGILVQLPLPRHIDKILVINSINPEKDVDGFHNANAGKLLTGQMDCMIPCTPQGCIHLIKKATTKLAGRKAVVIGRSNIVGKPVGLLLLYENCTVSILHSSTADIHEHCRNAEIVVAAVGKARMVQAEWVQPGAIVIDVGINLITNEGKNKFVGDVDFEPVSAKASAITPVPGGVGPMTIAFLMVNTVLGACMQNGIKKQYEIIKSSLLQ